MQTPTDTKLCYRVFIRGAGFQDLPASNEFLNRNFVDNFGVLLQKPGRTNRLLTFDDVIREYWDKDEYTVKRFLVADGAAISYSESNRAWFNPGVRCAVVVTPRNVQAFEKSSWTIFIVGSDQFDSTENFLQIASWDGHTLRFYSRTTFPNGTYAWVYQGCSWDAFDPETAYLGPFNGHVNGGPVMKELQRPWLHWHSPVKAVHDCLSPAQIEHFKSKPYLMDAQGKLDLTLADDMQSIVERGVPEWYRLRMMRDFKENNGLKQSPSNTPRWMAHMLLTTTINIQCGEWNGNSVTVPANHFFNNEILQKYPKDDNNIYAKFGILTIRQDYYEEARSRLGLALLQEVRSFDQVPVDRQVRLFQGALGGDSGNRQVLFAKCLEGEGSGLFTILAPSFEDSHGVTCFQAITKKVSLLSLKLFKCLMMIDYWNPIYSWRRGILMQYMPEFTTREGMTYDLEHKFIKALINSPNARCEDTVEGKFLDLYNNYGQYNDNAAQNTKSFRNRIASYVASVRQRLDTPEGVFDYMMLAESRRRIYRVLPLNEFGLTLPFAVNYPTLDSLPVKEMSESGEVVDMPERGKQFLTKWTGTLWTNDPKLLPSQIAQHETSEQAESLAPVSPMLLPKKERTPEFSSHCLRPSMQTSATSCPIMQKSPKEGNIANTERAELPNRFLTPTWSDTVAMLFRRPFWIEESHREKVGEEWVAALKYWRSLDSFDYDAVRGSARIIHEDLRTLSLPRIGIPSDHWPELALWAFRQWANQGFRVNDRDPFHPKTVIPEPQDKPERVRMRKNISSLTSIEVQEYREKLDDILDVGSIGSPWQGIGKLHSEWSLHHQEAFSFWNRALLLYVEELMGIPIPYWNFTDPATADPDSPRAGLPQIFLDEKYSHRSRGERPNPLRFALAKDGLSNSGAGGYVSRDEPLVAGRSHPDWATKIRRTRAYHSQIAHSLGQKSFSQPRRITHPPGRSLEAPRASNDNVAEDHLEGDLYHFYFDKLLEQARDNWIAWIGPDMASNEHAGFDPIWLSFHCNLDRIVTEFLAAHPECQLIPSFPLRPFLDNGKVVDYNEPRASKYTTVGDMAKDPRALGYVYAPPSYEQDPAMLELKDRASDERVAFAPSIPKDGRLSTRGVGNIEANSKRKLEAWVIWKHIDFTVDSFSIDVFVQGAESTKPDPVENPKYIGTSTQLGMGKRINDRQQTSITVTRVLPIPSQLRDDVERNGIQQVVYKLPAEEVIEEDVWKKWKGFTGELRWFLPA